MLSELRLRPCGENTTLEPSECLHVFVEIIFTFCFLLLPTFRKLLAALKEQNKTHSDSVQVSIQGHEPTKSQIWPRVKHAFTLNLIFLQKTLNKRKVIGNNKVERFMFVFFDKYQKLSHWSKQWRKRNNHLLLINAQNVLCILALNPDRSSICIYIYIFFS